MATTEQIAFAIDRGGTFTDVYATLPDGSSRVLKLLSDDPANYPDAPREGIRRVLEQWLGRALPADELDGRYISSIRMGTTVATNALLERKGARTLLLISAGLGDALFIGNQSRADIFALNVQRPEPLYAEVLEVDERIRPARPHDDGVCRGIDGERYAVLREPDWGALAEELVRARRRGCTSAAVVLAHAYAWPQHELRLGRLLAEAGFAYYSLSHQVMPTVRLVPRGLTTVVDAYLAGHISRYIDSFRRGFADGLKDTPVLFMASDGGLVEAEAFSGSRALLSGPAGGVVGYAASGARALGDAPLIGFDMGGTSTDVSRFAGEYRVVHAANIAGVPLHVPHLDIRTVAAGGGSRLFFRQGMFEVGPESAGAHPGPVCYRKNGFLTVTDANLVLGRLQPDFFPHIFGADENQPLDVAGARAAMAALTEQVNDWMTAHGRAPMSVEEVAAGFVAVANAVMARPIRAVSQQRGFSLEEHALVCFGGAGGQHACAMARQLGIKTVLVPRHAGVLSACGIAQARRVCELQEPASGELSPQLLATLTERLRHLQQRACAELGCRSDDAAVECSCYLNLRYRGSDTAIMVKTPADGDYRAAFAREHLREFGFVPTAAVLVDDVRVRVSCAPPPQVIARSGDGGQSGGGAVRARARRRCYFADGWCDTPVYLLEELPTTVIVGAALIIQDGATIVIEPGCRARIIAAGDVIISVAATTPADDCSFDPVRLALFQQRFISIAEQMGYTLQRTAVSTNIKERCDFSCALFNAAGELVANAPHTPVHLGAMSAAVRCQIDHFGADIAPGDVLVSNHPRQGGSHLPDITVVTPLWHDGAIVMYVASRGHHADIGGDSPGSMPPFSRTLAQEGSIISATKLVSGGEFMTERMRALLAGSRRLEDNIADLKAQVAANQCGINLLTELFGQVGVAVVDAYSGYLNQHAEQVVRAALQRLYAGLECCDGTGRISACDYLDDGSAIDLDLTIAADGSARFDFSASAAQQWGNLNAPAAVTMSAVIYCLRAVAGEDIPLNHGCLRPVEVCLRPGSILDPHADAAVVGGNVLTSQRLVDVIFKAFGCVAAAQGCMNNVTFGNDGFGYYETIGGGSGAGPGWHGCSGVHTHMTNTRITDVEVVERRYPVVVRRFALRRGSGGAGRWRGGDGLVRELEFLAPLQVAVLSERRVFAPYGLAGGGSGARGRNILIRADGSEISLGGKNSFDAAPGDRLRIETPGGGGYGQPE